MLLMLTSLRHSISSVLSEIFYAGYEGEEKQGQLNAAILKDTPRYPPIDQGVPSVSADSVMESQNELIVRIQQTAGIPPDEFEARYMPVIKNLARYVHLLPATRTSHHRGAGGLFRLCLEMGLYTLQLANSTIFNNKGSVTAEGRYRLQPKWIYATFIAGMCSEIYRPVTNMVVTNGSGEKWPQLLMPLTDWLAQKGCRNYYLNWNIQDESSVIAAHQSTAAYILNVIVPMHGLQYLNEDNTDIVATMTSCVTNSVAFDSKNQLQEITKGIRKKVIDRDLKYNAERYGDFTVGAHLEPYILNAMRSLLKSSVWEVNTKGARIWKSKEGTFIVWQPAARELTEILKEGQHPGIPSEADTLADILISCGVGEQNDDEGRYWEICIPTGMQILPALKLSRPEVLFSDPKLIEPIAESLLADEATKKKKAGKKRSSLADLKQTSFLLDDPVQQTAPSATTKEAAKPEPAQDKKKTVIDKTAKPQETPKRAQAKPEVEIPTPVFVPNEMDKTDLIVQRLQEKAASSSIDSADVESAVENGVNLQEGTDEAETEVEASKFLAALPKAMGEYMKAVIDDAADETSTGPVFSAAEGMAISILELNSHGQSNFTSLIQTLDTKGWLWVDPEKPMKKLIDLEYEGESVKAIVIRKEVARDMGFNWKKPKKENK